MAGKWKKLTEQWFVGEVTISKTTIWLIGGICLLGGIVYGLCKAPFTHGVTIGSNNGNSFGCAGDVENGDEEERIGG